MYDSATSEGLLPSPATSLRISTSASHILVPTHAKALLLPAIPSQGPIIPLFFIRLSLQPILDPETSALVHLRPFSHFANGVDTGRRLRYSALVVLRVVPFANRRTIALRFLFQSIT